MVNEIGIICLLIFGLINILFFTAPLMVRLSFLIGDLVDNFLEKKEREYDNKT